MLELNTELCNRISKSHIGHILTTGNKISIMFYGKVIKFEIKLIKGEEMDVNLADSFKNINLDKEDLELYKIDESTKWKIYK